MDNLVEYNRFLNHTKNIAAQWFAEKGFAVDPKLAYVLKENSQWKENIILSEVAEFLENNLKMLAEKGKRGYLHKHIRSGVSSQAMVFNLIGPLIVKKDLTPLEKVITSAGIPWPKGNAKVEFEFEDHKILGEDLKRPTSVDVVVKDENENPKIFIEAKFTEKKFGGCSSSSSVKCEGRNPVSDISLCYLHNHERHYWELMLEDGYHKGTIYMQEKCILIDHYQFFRNSLLATQTGGIFVLLHDARSPVFEKDAQGIMPYLLSMLPDILHNSIMTISVQDIVKAIKEANQNDWIGEFERKYGLGHNG